VSKLKRLLCYESQHQSQSNEKSLVQFDYEKAVSNYLGTQSTFKGELLTRECSALTPTDLFLEEKVHKTLVEKNTWSCPVGLIYSG